MTAVKTVQSGKGTWSSCATARDNRAAIAVLKHKVNSALWVLIHVQGPFQIVAMRRTPGCGSGRAGARCGFDVTMDFGLRAVRRVDTRGPEGFSFMQLFA